MSLIVISGDFSSGTTLVFTLFRNTPGCYGLYEPLHAKLPEYLIWAPRAYEGHRNVGQYFSEYRGFDRVSLLFDPRWAAHDLSLGPTDRADDLYRYFSYLVGTAHGRAPTVVLKDNRLSFRLGWLRASFPRVRIVNVYRDLDEQWQSWVRRAQDQLGREEIGQEQVDFQAFRLADWCEDLKARYPELAAEQSRSGYERFAKLWRLSREEHERHADVCVNHQDFVDSFDSALARVSRATGVALDPESLRPLVIDPRSRPRERRRPEGIIERAGRRYAKARVARMRRAARV